jgi:hypothetical protein
VIIAETYVQLLHNWPHWAFEMTVEAVTGIAGWVLARPFFRRWLKRHDRAEHATHEFTVIPDNDLAAKIWSDLIVYGNAYLRRDQNGTVTRLDPQSIRIQVRQP